jgi:Uncharacterised nucleotidyltransferase
MPSERKCLAAWITGQPCSKGKEALPEGCGALLVALAVQDGVACLLDRSLRQVPVGADVCFSQDDLLTLRAAVHQETLASMLLETETRRVLAAAQALSIDTLLLKGNALAWWAYPEPQLRSCGDVDVLVPSREAAEQLARALAELGYARPVPSGDLVAHELMCTLPVTPEWTLEIDVHWRLNNTTLFAHLFDFDALMGASIALPGLAPNARGLGPVDALLHAAVHRARNLANGVGDALKWLYDVVVLTAVLGDDDWMKLVGVARQKQIAGVTLSALEAAEDMFACAFPDAVRRGLRDAARGESLDVERLQDWRYMQVQNFRSVSGVGPRLRWLWQRLFPSGDDMRQMYGLEGAYITLLQERGRRFWNKWRQR